jgi:hypothetical protein
MRLNFFHLVKAIECCSAVPSSVVANKLLQETVQCCKLTMSNLWHTYRKLKVDPQLHTKLTFLVHILCTTTLPYTKEKATKKKIILRQRGIGLTESALLIFTFVYMVAPLYCKLLIIDVGFFVNLFT